MDDRQLLAASSYFRYLAQETENLRLRGTFAKTADVFADASREVRDRREHPQSLIAGIQSDR